MYLTTHILSHQIHASLHLHQKVHYRVSKGLVYHYQKKVRHKRFLYIIHPQFWRLSSDSASTISIWEVNNNSINHEIQLTSGNSSVHSSLCTVVDKWNRYTWNWASHSTYDWMRHCVQGSILPTLCLMSAPVSSVCYCTYHTLPYTSISSLHITIIHYTLHVTIISTLFRKP